VLYLVLTLGTFAVGVITLARKKGQWHTSQGWLHFRTKEFEGKPAVIVGLAYSLLGLIFTVDALHITFCGGNGAFALFCGSWIGLGVIYNLYMHDYFNSAKD
jgi:hypothetical protein